MKKITLLLSHVLTLSLFCAAEGAGPLPPVLVSPANGATGQALNVKLDWNAVPNVMMYAWELDTTPNFNSSFFQSGTTNYINSSNNNTDTEHQCTGLITGIKYYWRARCSDSQGGVSNWSQVFSFTTITLGVSEARRNIEFSVYADGPLLHLRFGQGIHQEAEISVYNMLGEKVLFAKEYAADRLQLRMESAEPGIYFVFVETGTAKGSRKLVVSR